MSTRLHFGIGCAPPNEHEFKYGAPGKWLVDIPPTKIRCFIRGSLKFHAQTPPKMMSNIGTLKKHTHTHTQGRCS